jgi:hypothetical protein
MVHTTWDLKTVDMYDVQLDELTKYVIQYHQHSSIKAFFCYCLCVQGFALICLGLSIDLILLYSQRVDQFKFAPREAHLALEKSHLNCVDP